MLPTFLYLGCIVTATATILSKTTFKLNATLDLATPTTVQNFTGTTTIIFPVSHVETPTPQLQDGKMSSMASNFGTSCCGWGGLFGWSGTGRSVATISGHCTGLSSLDLNKCLSWNAKDGYVDCSTAGGFLSNAAAACRVFSPPSVFGRSFDKATYTEIYVVCNGPNANTGYVTHIDLNGCIGVDSLGRLTC